MIVAASAQAALLTTATRSTNFSFAEGPAVFIPLNDASATSLGFNTSAANQKIVISFTAECAASDNIGSWVNIDILVDGVAVKPTNTTADAFCTSDATGKYLWAANAYNGVIVVPAAGGHILRIRANVQSGNGGGTG